MDTKLSTANQIVGYVHCAKCLRELPAGQSPQDYARVQAGVTADGGIQVWCNRHDCNVAKINSLSDLPTHHCDVPGCCN